jgi:hypothetical protein
MSSSRALTSNPHSASMTQRARVHRREASHRSAALERAWAIDDEHGALRGVREPAERRRALDRRA